MKCLLERLSSFNEEDVLWIAESIGFIEIGMLIQAINGVDSSEWKGKSVAIGALPAIEFLTTLVFLDGLAKKIILLPLEDAPHTREARLIDAKVDTVLENDGLGFTELFTQIELNGSLQSTYTTRPKTTQTTWLLPTSGTTGDPKLIAHTFSTLTRSMSSRRVGDEFIWGSLYSLRRFAGLQVFLQSWMSSTPLVLNNEGVDIHELMNRFITTGCNALSATPSMWRKLSMYPLFDRLQLKQITMGGEIVDQVVLDMLKNKFPDARITHIYASTEAGVGFVVKDGKAGFPTDYLHHPPLGVAMRIDEFDHLWLRTSSENLLSASNAEYKWIDSGDVVKVQGDRIHFLGRANGSINIGGNKVMPEEVEAVIKELTEVAFVQVRARKSTLLGSLVEAVIIPSLGCVVDDSFKKRVITHCRNKLESFKVPAFIVSSNDIQMTASGKLLRKNYNE